MFGSGFQANVGPLNPGASLGVKSVQVVTFDPTGTSATYDQTITAVDTSNTILLYPRFTGPGAAPQGAQFRIELTSGTNVRATRSGTGTLSSGNAPLRATVIEFYPGFIKSIQRGTIAMVAPATSGTAAISAVNTDKAFVNHLGSLASTGAANGSVDSNATLSLSSSTQVSASKYSSANDVTVGYEVVEFY